MTNFFGAFERNKLFKMHKLAGILFVKVIVVSFHFKPKLFLYSSYVISY